jgi:hypothetical protein
MASKRVRDVVGIDPDRVVSAALEAALGEPHSRGKRHHPGRVLAASAALAAAAAVGQRRMPRLAKAPLRMGLHKLGDMTHVDELADALRDRLVGREDEPDDDEYSDDEDLDDEDYDEQEEFDDEPRGNAEDDSDDEDGDEGFDDEDDEGFDDEPEDDDGPRDEGDEVDDEEFDDEPEDDVEGNSDEEEPEETEPEAADDDENLEPEDDDEQIAARSLELGVPSGPNGRRAHDRVPDLFEALRTPHRRAPVMRRGSRRVDPATRPPTPDESRPRRERRGRSNNPKSTAARA